MATEDRFEAIVSAGLQRYLGSAVGPHAQWLDAPAARTVAALALVPRRPHRWPRASLLLAAALTVVLVSAAILVAGGITRPSLPLPLPTSAPLTAPATPPVDASPPPAAVVADPTPGDTQTQCASEWSSTGTAPAKGLADGIRVVELDGSDGGVSMVFGHSLDTVRDMSIAPTRPPFVTSDGKKVHIAGNAFLRLTISGLDKPTSADDDMVSGAKVRLGAPTVSAPITEMRRIQTPVRTSPLKEPPKTGSAEVWIIGVDYAPCIRVRTVRLIGYGNDDPGDNALRIDFDRPPAPLPATPTPPTLTSPAVVGAPERAPLVVPLDYTLGSDWRVLIGSPNLVEVTYALGLRYAPVTIEGDPKVAIGVPYGYDSDSQFLAELRTRPCPGMVILRQLTVAGITGPGFYCPADENLGLRALYPITKEGRAAGVPATLDAVAGWMILNKGDDALSVVAEEGGRPVVITVFGHSAAAHFLGPIVGLDTATEQFLEEGLHLTFAR